MSEISVSTVLTDVGAIFTQAIDWIGDLCTAIVGNPLLLICVVGFLTVGFTVGLLTRLLRA